MTKKKIFVVLIALFLFFVSSSQVTALGGNIKCDSDSDCGSVGYGEWSPCTDFSSVCDETGTQTRRVTKPVCKNPGEIASYCTTKTTTESRDCSRNTDGKSCGVEKICQDGECVKEGQTSCPELYEPVCCASRSGISTESNSCFCRAKDGIIVRRQECSEKVIELYNETSSSLNLSERVEEAKQKIENATQKANETLENLNQTLKEKKKEFLDNLTSVTIKGAAVPVPKSLEDEVENNKPDVPKASYSHAFLLLNKEKYYLVLTQKDFDKGCGTVEGKLLPNSVSWKGKSLSFVLGQEISISREGEEATIREIRQSPKQYRYKCVDLDSTVRELSALYDPDQGNEVTLPTSAGIVIKDPVTTSEFVKKIRDKSEQLVKNPENEKVKEILQNEKEYLPIFDFKTKFWTGSKANIDAIVLLPKDVLSLVKEKGSEVKELVYSTNNATLYSIKENLKVEGLNSIEETFTKSEKLKGKTVSFEARGYGKLISVQEELEHKTECGNEKIPVEGGCVNVPVDVLLQGFVAFGKLPEDINQARKRTLITIGASNHHQDKPETTINGTFRYTGKLVSMKQINESLPKGLALITFKRKKVGELNYSELEEETKNVVKDRLSSVKKLISKSKEHKEESSLQKGSNQKSDNLGNSVGNFFSSIGKSLTEFFGSLFRW